MKKILYILCIINLQNSFCQQILPIDLLAYPNQNRFSISGTGGANGAEIKGASLSAQAAIDFNRGSIKVKSSTSVEVVFGFNNSGESRFFGFWQGRDLGFEKISEGFHT
jgi:hypothetical protein